MKIATTPRICYLVTMPEEQKREKEATFLLDYVYTLDSIVTKKSWKGLFLFPYFAIWESLIEIRSFQLIQLLLSDWYNGEKLLSSNGCSYFWTIHTACWIISVKKSLFWRSLLKDIGQQPWPLLHSINIWPASNSRQTQRETNPI